VGQFDMVFNEQDSHRASVNAKRLLGKAPLKAN
jgi:hypothetical protein